MCIWFDVYRIHCTFSLNGELALKLSDDNKALEALIAEEKITSEISKWKFRQAFTALGELYNEQQNLHHNDEHPNTKFEQKKENVPQNDAQFKEHAEVDEEEEQHETVHQQEKEEESHANKDEMKLEGNQQSSGHNINKQTSNSGNKKRKAEKITTNAVPPASSHDRTTRDVRAKTKVVT